MSREISNSHIFEICEPYVPVHHAGTTLWGLQLRLQTTVAVNGPALSALFKASQHTQLRGVEISRGRKRVQFYSSFFLFSFG